MGLSTATVVRGWSRCATEALQMLAASAKASDASLPPAEPSAEPAAASGAHGAASAVRAGECVGGGLSDGASAALAAGWPAAMW